MNKLKTLVGALAVSLPTTAAFGAPAEKAWVVILTGSNNHDWQETTRELKGILEEGGGSTVEVVEQPERLLGGTLDECDVLLSNWNNWVGGKKNAPAPVPWSPELRKAYVDFVGNGGGHVVVHAGSSSFFDWGDYQQITGATWKLGQTRHGPQHEFKVRPTKVSHPIVEGLEPFKTRDELWTRPGVQPGMTVLAEAWSELTGDWEPSALAGQFGRGRCFTLLLGHGPEHMRNPGFRRLLLRGVKWAAAGEAGASANTNDLRWKRGQGSLALLKGDRIVWQYNYRKDDTKPCFHPVAALDGTVLTELSPADHPWHRALWFAWKFINGVNYWEESRETGRSDGVTEILETKALPLADHSCVITQRLSYHLPGEKELLSEKREIKVGAPAADGSYPIDWKAVFIAADAPVVLDRTPRPGENDGKPHGGYAGFSIRTAKETVGWEMRDSQGRINDAIHGQPAEWVLMSGKSGNGREVGVAIFDHPANPRHPSPWFIVTRMPYFSPALLFNEAMTLKPHETLTLRYRVLLLSGPASNERLEREMKGFAGFR